MNLFGVGVPEAGLIFVLALILVGPQRFPEIARQAGRWYRTARTFTDAVMKDVRAAVDEIEDEIGVAGEGGGLNPIRELTGGLRRDLTEALEGPLTGEPAATDAPAVPPPSEGEPSTAPEATPLSAPEPSTASSGTGA